MNFVQNFLPIIDLTLDLIFSNVFIIIVALLVIFIHIILLSIRDRSYIKPIKNIKRIDITFNDLKQTPTVNIIVPAWKEGEILRSSLLAIKNLSYPKIKVIVNAGGSKETEDIADSFNNYTNFIIIRQKKGRGKNAAINDALDYVSEGLIYIIDVGTLLSDDIVISMVYYIVNLQYDVLVGGFFPHYSLLNSDLVKYLFLNRNTAFRKKFRPNEMDVIGANLCFSNKVLEEIGRKIPEGMLGDDNRAIGNLFKTKKFKVRQLLEKRAETLNYPSKVTESITQNIRWIDNSLSTMLRAKKKFSILKFILLSVISIYILISPFLILVNIYLFLFGLIFFESQYLSRIRKCIFYNKTANKDQKVNLSFIFFIKLIFYTYLDVLIRIVAFFEVFFFRKKYKKRKNLI
ncbi:MAG: glycosyltransferase family 2 protein [Candidatus Lokiarchaeota archaeon]|nr:glycosyltransferase family 2 protein [Candidatus Lokiarchaeota archaeon]